MPHKNDVNRHIQKECSLCHVKKPLNEFGPKKGSRDGTDCYCRICGHLRRRFGISVRRCRLHFLLLFSTWSSGMQAALHIVCGCRLVSRCTHRPASALA